MGIMWFQLFVGEITGKMVGTMDYFLDSEQLFIRVVDWKSRCGLWTCGLWSSGGCMCCAH